MILQSNWFINQHLIFEKTHKKNYFLDNHTCTTVTAFFLPRGAIDNVILFSTSASFFLAFIIPEIIKKNILMFFRENVLWRGTFV